MMQKHSLFKKVLCFLLIMSAVMGMMCISLTASAATYYERESNDSYATATSITLNNSYKGVINSNTDKDYYKIVAPANGKISLNFNHVYQDSFARWSVNVYRYVNGAYNELSSDRVYFNDNEKFTLPFIGAVKGGVYYIKVERGNNYSDVIGVNYVIQTAFKANDYLEKEFNDVYSTATPVILNNTYGGVINSYSDKDYYKIVAPANGRISLNFNHVYQDSFARWSVNVYRYVNGAYNELSSDRVYFSDNEKFTLPFIGAVKGGVYYIKVERGNNYSDVIGYGYSLKISMPIPGISKISATPYTNAVKLSWSKAGGANGYQIQLQKSGKWANYANTTATSYTAKSLKAGTIYCFRVRSFINYKGTKYYSGWKAITMATKPVTPTIYNPASDKLHRIKVKWKSVAAGTGYVVQISTNKSFKKSVTTQRVSGRTSNNYIFRKLKKGTRYYVRVQAYKTFGKNRSYSAWSKTKTIVCK